MAKLPLPKMISDRLFNSNTKDFVKINGVSSTEGYLDATKTVALVQWAQFVEHDLVKTVVQTMGGFIQILHNN